MGARSENSAGCRSDGILLGFAQAMALVPGVSRSGGTISASLLLGFTREPAARYSFLLAIPAVLASGVFQLFSHWQELSAVMALPTAVASLTAFIVGCAVIVIVLRLISTHRYLPFVVYRLLLGTTLLALSGLGVIAPL